MKQLWVAIAVVAALTVLTAVQGEAAGIHEAVLALAENVLGAGSVKSVRTTDNGAQVLIRWESATYRPANDLPTTRELMYAEAVLTTNSVMGLLPQVVRVRFTILEGVRMLATGENWRGRGVSLAFATELGGGTYKAPQPKVDPHKKPGADVAREM